MTSTESHSVARAATIGVDAVQTDNVASRTWQAPESVLGTDLHYLDSQFRASRAVCLLQIDFGHFSRTVEIAHFRLTDSFVLSSNLAQFYFGSEVNVGFAAHLHF